MTRENTISGKDTKWLGAGTRALKARILALTAPTSRDEDSRRQELILNIILLISMLFLAVLEVTVIVNTVRLFPNYHGIHWTILILVIAGCGLMLMASKSGHARAISYTIISLYGAGALYGGWHWGVSLPAILLSFALISVTASILIGSGFGFIVSGLVIVSLTVLSVHEIYTLGVLPWKYETITATDVVTYSAILVFIAALSWMSNREIQKSLERARSSENALANERDLLEIKVKERTEELHKAQAERMSEISRIAEFGRLSQGLFHDLMTPLSSVALHMEKLRDVDMPEAHEARAYLNKAVTASHKMGNFMNLIRSHIRQGGKEDGQSKTDSVKGHRRETPYEKPHSITTELDTAIELLKYKAQQAKVFITTETDHDVLYPGNAIHFQRIFLNLISNAIEAHEGTPDRLDGDEKRIEIVISKKDNAAEIRISDNGPGIPAEDMRHIFEPFFSTKSPDKGIGVGLSTVKSIVEEKLKGTIEVKSTLGEKTSFVISFPCN